jgi:hypothetical protein
MAGNLGQWVGPFVPVVLMVSIIVLNHTVVSQRADRKTANEGARFVAALAAELRAILELYKTNLELIEQKADYILSTRSSVLVYKGNLGRLTLLLDRPVIEHVVGVFAQNERIEMIIAARSNFRCNLTYQFSPADARFDEWRQMYEQAMERVAATCRMLEAGEGSLRAPEANGVTWRVILDQFFYGSRDLGEKRNAATGDT